MRIRTAHTRNGVRALWIAVFSLGFHVLAAHGQQANSSASENQKWNYAEMRKAPEKARDMHNPLENDPDAVRAGGKLFERECSGCHGMKAEGKRKAPSLLRDEVQQAPPGSIFWVLTNGVVWHGMPDWSKLPEAERWQIVTFLKSQKTPSGQGGMSGQ